MKLSLMFALKVGKLLQYIVTKSVVIFPMLAIAWGRPQIKAARNIFYTHIQLKGYLASIEFYWKGHLQKNLPTKDKVTGGVQRLIRFLDKIVLKRNIIHSGSCIQKTLSSRKMEG